MNHTGILVIKETLHLLSEQTNWNKNSSYKEDCEKLSAKPFYTLACALYFAQKKIRGKNDFRAIEMNVLRRLIYKHFFFRAGIHPINGFNKHKKTNYQDVIKVLELTLAKLRNE